MQALCAHRGLGFSILAKDSLSYTSCSTIHKENRGCKRNQHIRFVAINAFFFVTWVGLIPCSALGTITIIIHNKC